MRYDEDWYKALLDKELLTMALPITFLLFSTCRLRPIQGKKTARAMGVGGDACLFNKRHQQLGNIAFGGF